MAGNNILILLSKVSCIKPEEFAILQGQDWKLHQLSFQHAHLYDLWLISLFVFTAFNIIPLKECIYSRACVIFFKDYVLQLYDATCNWSAHKHIGSEINYQFMLMLSMCDNYFIQLDHADMFYGHFMRNALPVWFFSQSIYIYPYFKDVYM